MNYKSKLFYIAYNLCVVLLVLSMIEIFLVWQLHSPEKIVPSPKNVLKRLLDRIYMLDQRNIIQYMPECAQYSAATGYTLKPGTFSFSNIEFHTDYQVNSMGLRDDEESLLKPEMIVLGDSFAMGWGVEQDQTYAQILEKKLGQKVLNAGISSFGTVRELFMLNQLDVSSLQTLIIHYCPNDVEENKSFFDNKEIFRVMTEEKYNKICQSYQSNKAYFPGKYLVRAISYIKEFLLRTKESTIPSAGFVGQTAEEYFAYAMNHACTYDLKKWNVIVITNEQDFESFQKVWPHARYLNEEEFLTQADFYNLDDHYRPSGHEKIADALYKLLVPS